MAGPDATQAALPFSGLIFDMDGTLTKPVIDFGAMRRDLAIPSGDIASVVLSWPPEKQAWAWEIIRGHEEIALEKMALQDGCAGLLGACRARGLKLGVVTRNSKESTQHLCERFGLQFDTVVTREFPWIKPHPGPVLHILEQWQAQAGRVMMIGDYIHDIECGHAAGVKTCFFHNPGFPDWSQAADYTVHTMAELARIVLPGGL